MSHPTRDDGLSASQLWGTSWVLGLLSVGCFVRMFAYTLDSRPGDGEELLLWLFLGLGALVLCAACATIGAVKGAEGRIRAEVQYLTQRPVDGS